MISQFPIGFDDDILEIPALALATQYGFHLAQDALPRLQLTAQALVLLLEKFSPLQVDLWVKQRLDKQHGLIRACKPQPGMCILDATAGWGRDAALLAQYGAKILLLERQPVMAALLADGLRRLPPNVTNIALIHQDTFQYLQQLAANFYPDVIYIDPMHPERQKSALVKKDMQALQHLFGPDDDAHALLAMALSRVKKRVVVKWPQRLPSLKHPNSSISGKTVRFDIYLP